MDRLKNLKGAIFDLDGTILDSTRLWKEIDVRFLAKRGIGLPEDYADAIGAMAIGQAAEYTVARFSLSDSPADLIAEWREMAARAYAEEIGLKPFAKEYLFALHARGVRLAVATSSEESLFLPALKRNGIEGLFSAFVTAQEVGAGKDFPRVYCRAAELLGLRPEACAVFEDLPTGIRSASGAGFLTVGVYDSATAHRTREVRDAADLFIRSFRELL